jgi:hypothetical protein
MIMFRPRLALIIFTNVDILSLELLIVFIMICGLKSPCRPRSDFVVSQFYIDVL